MTQGGPHVLAQLPYEASQNIPYNLVTGFMDRRYLQVLAYIGDIDFFLRFGL
jgi:hypothetical protein